MHVEGSLSNEKTERRISTRDLFEAHLKVAGDRMTDTSAKRLVYTMRRLGWDGPKPLKIGEQVVRGYSKNVNGS